MSDDRGYTLVELLVAMGLMTIVLMAVLTTFDGFNVNQRRTSDRADAQDRARTAIDRLTREMRNGVSLGAPTPQSVERMADDDLIFQTVGRGPATTGNPTRNVRVRYCLNATNPADARLVRQQQTFAGAPTPMPTGTACPGPDSAGWSSTSVVADRITNRFAGANRRVFTRRFSDPAAETANDLSKLIAIMPTLYVDVTPGPQAPAETALRSGVELRNANQSPTALFSVSVIARKLFLDASASIDPEQQQLTYAWRVTSSTGATWNLTQRRAETVTLDAGSYTVRLTVTDPAGAFNVLEKVQVINP